MNKINSLRQEKNLTLKELADILGVSEATVSRWENGKSDIRGKNLKKLSDFFDVSESYILGYSDFKNGTEYYNHKVKQIDEDEEKDYDNNESDYDDDYFDRKKFILSVESDLIDEIGEDKLKVIKQDFIDSFGTGSDYENIYANTLEIFVKLGLSAERDGYENTDFERDLLNININFHLLTDENRDELTNFQNYLLYKQNLK